MNIDTHVSLYLDTRRSKKNGKYPIKLRVFCAIPRKQKLYQLNIDADEKVFNDAYFNPKTKKNESFRIELNDIEKNVKEIIKTLKPFTFEAFEKKYLAITNIDILDVFYHYRIKINELNINKQFGTASNYRLSMNSLIKFLDFKEAESNRLYFNQIDKKWLEEYEKFMLNDFDKKQASLTTISMYLRALRAIFNSVMDNKDFYIDIFYPFGAKKYQIPSSIKVKKALNSDELKILFNSIPATKEQEKARDFWFFSFACNGMNIKDIALLKYSNLESDSFTYKRAKTILTSRKKQIETKIFYNDFILNIISKYGNENKKDNYVFPILSDTNTDYQNYKAVKNFTKFINQNIKKLAINNGITEDLSTYWARHSFATNSIRKGAKMEFISEALNHKDLATTQAYFAGFEDSTKKEFSNNLMNF